MAPLKAALRSDRVYPDLQTYFEDPFTPTQSEIARELGIAESLLSMIKSGQREPDLRLALQLQDRCRVPMESLIRPKRRKAS